MAVRLALLDMCGFLLVMGANVDAKGKARAAVGARRGGRSGGRGAVGGEADPLSWHSHLPDRPSAPCPARSTRASCERDPATPMPPAPRAQDRRGRDGDTPLIVAAKEGRNPIVGYLLEANANVNAKGEARAAMGGQGGRSS